MKFFAAVLLIVSQLAWAKESKLDTFKIDPAHSSVVFKVNHLGFANVYGLIGGAEGTFSFDQSKPENSSFEVSVKVDTLTTLTEKRDAHLKGPDFFNVKQYPTVALKSKSVKKKGKDQYQVTADLTLHGVTKPITFVFKRMKTGKDPWGNIRTGGEARFKIKRTDYGMTFMSEPEALGSEVELFVNVEGSKQ